VIEAAVARERKGCRLPKLDPVVGQNSIAAVEPTKCPIGDADHSCDSSKPMAI